MADRDKPEKSFATDELTEWTEARRLASPMPALPSTAAANFRAYDGTAKVKKLQKSKEEKSGLPNRARQRQAGGG